MSETLKEMAEALKRGGIKASYNFPGFNSHSLFDYTGGGITSTNEKIAYELAWGSSQAGTPSLVTFKNVGLNDAADPFINSLLTGVGSGLVLTVFDDIELEGSQCILDSRHYFNFYGGLWLEPFNFKSLVTLAEAAPYLSRVFNIPVVIRLTNCSVRFKSQDHEQFISTPHIMELADIFAGKQFITSHIEPIVHPINGDKHRKLISMKNRTVQLFVDEMHRLINTNGVVGKVYCGRDAEEADSHVISLPVPDKNIGEVESVHEVGDSVISKDLEMKTATHIDSSNVGYNPDNARNYIVTSRYERLFNLLKPHYEYITGDLGEYTKDTLNTLTHCLCFGSAISIAIGVHEAGKNALAITGDASFHHSAKNAITEAVLRNIPIKVVLLDNGGSQGTGGQPIPGAMPQNIKIIEINLDDIRDKDLEGTINKFIISKEPTILKVNHKV